MQSTTTSKLNGDFKLSKTEKASYFLSAFKEEFSQWKSLDCTLLNPSKILKLEKMNVTANTPSRILGNLFWDSLPWGLFEKLLGKFNVLDFGCGAGEYFLRIKENIPSDFDYNGFDVYENKNWLNIPEANYHVYDGANYAFLKEKKPNFIFTQSALEHVPKDLEFFAACKEAAGSDPLIQVHLLPAPKSLFLYFLHGFRRYGYQQIKQILDISQADQAYLMPLGGSKSFWAHLKKFALPALRKQTIAIDDSDLSDIQATIEEDVCKPELKNAHFFALILAHNIKDPLFDSEQILHP